MQKVIRTLRDGLEILKTIVLLTIVSGLIVLCAFPLQLLFDWLLPLYIQRDTIAIVTAISFILVLNSDGSKR